MKTTPPCWQRLTTHTRALAALALGATAACSSGRPAPITQTASEARYGAAVSRLSCISDLAVKPTHGGANQLRVPWGDSKNGICMNGLTAVPLGGAALASQAFADWFNADPEQSDVVMSYVFSCAAPAGQTTTWTNPATSAEYFWPGGLGLARGWTSGNPATDAEQQIVSACLASLINKYGVHVTVALEGRGADGAQISIGADELTNFSVREGCFFGNVFDGEGLFVGADHEPLGDATSSPRACAFDHASGLDGACPPLVSVGACADLCQPDATGTFYESCTFGGNAYLPIVTRLTPDTLFTCGDGICQFPEQCGTGSTWNDCADCGACP